MELKENGDLRMRENAIPRLASIENSSLSSFMEELEIESEEISPLRGEFSEKDDDFYDEMHPIFTMLRFFGLLPSRNPYPRNRPGIFWSALFAALTILFFAVNIGVLCFNVYVIELVRSEHGMLHVVTMATILTGVKPLQNIFNLATFASKWQLHLQMLVCFRDVDQAFRLNFQTEPNWRKGRCTIFALTAFLGVFAFTGRMAQFILVGDAMGEPNFKDVLNDLISFFVVPMLSIWQLVPLFYFFYLNKLLCFWYNSLEKAIKRDYKLTEHNMNFYYRHYLMLCKSVFTMGRFLNPFIFFSLAISVIVLCLTIYFVINADIAIQVHPNATTMEKVSVYFFPLWAGLQIITAILYVITISLAGLRTNEQARAILGTVLAIAPKDQKDQFQIICFMHKIQSQTTWGVTVWRAFPVERSLLFTLFGMISTYAVVLLKLQKSHMAQHGVSLTEPCSSDVG